MTEFEQDDLDRPGGEVDEEEIEPAELEDEDEESPSPWAKFSSGRDLDE